MARPLNRRRLLGGALPAAADAVGRVVEARLERSLPMQRRPPGAVGEALFQALCTRCDDCIDACPHGVVLRYTHDAGLNAHTPVMRPDVHACAMCEDFPCAAACPEGALEKPSTKTWRLGALRLREDVCIAYLGPECGACIGLCPQGLDALVLEGSRPKLDAERCVGCGLCIPACPTSPKALELLPLTRDDEDRVGRPGPV